MEMGQPITLDQLKAFLYEEQPIKGPETLDVVG